MSDDRNEYNASETTLTLKPAASPRRRWIALATVATVLLVGAVGLNATVGAMKLSFKKQAVPLRQPIRSLPADMGPWVQVTFDERFSAEIEAELGTLDYIDRWYVDKTKADAAVRAEWEAAPRRTEELGAKLMASAKANDPLSAVKLHIAYYTGGVDTVPHIPDRCMVAGGFAPTNREVADLSLSDGSATAAFERDALTVSFTQFQENRGENRKPVTLDVAYVFQVNGAYEYDAITGVRKRLQNLLESHGYFAKIELLTVAEDMDAAPAKAAMGRFLGHALPEIEAILPDWEQVTADAAKTPEAGAAGPG